MTDCISGVNPQWESAALEVWHQYFAETCLAADVYTWIDRQLAPKTLALHHVLLKVRDFERSKRFYFDLLGFSERPGAKPLADGRLFVSTRQGLGITVRGSGDQGQVDHFAFAVRNVEALSRQLKEAGVVFDRELGDGPLWSGDLYPGSRRKYSGAVRASDEWHIAGKIRWWNGGTGSARTRPSAVLVYPPKSG